MNRNYLFLIAVFIGSFALAFILTDQGCNKSTQETESSAESALDHSQHSDELPSPTIDQRIDQALANIEKGRETQDFNLMMQQGVMKLREIEEQDSTNERVLYHLGKLSLESMQLEKAKIRFKKLILLQPSNEEYQKLYDEVLRKLGEK